MPAAQRHIVIVGAGFAGLYLAKSLRLPGIRVTLVDRRNFHLFQPLLYQVATGGLSPANIAVPLRRVLKRRRNVRVLMAELLDIDPIRKVVMLSTGELGYDDLVLATGTETSYFGRDEWSEPAPGLKTLEDATEIRRRVLEAFERAEAASTAADAADCLRFVVVGGGPTGVELAGALAEIARDTLRHEFRRIDPARAEIMLIEAADRALPQYAPELSARAAADLGRLGVTVRTNVRVAEVHADRADLRTEAGEIESVATRVVLWAAGVRASPIGALLERRLGARLDRMGRVHVRPDCTLAGDERSRHDCIFVIGDLACFEGPDGPLPGVAQVAMQQGRYVAGLIGARLSGRTLPPFHYRDRGNMATIGRARAVAQIGRRRHVGLTAWLLWLLIHIVFLIEFENRVLVLFQWLWNYLTWGRSARLILGRQAPSRT